MEWFRDDSSLPFGVGAGGLMSITGLQADSPPVTPLAAKPPQWSDLDSERHEASAYADTGQGRARRPAADAKRYADLAGTESVR